VPGVPLLKLTKVLGVAGYRVASSGQGLQKLVYALGDREPCGVFGWVFDSQPRSNGREIIFLLFLGADRVIQATFDRVIHPALALTPEQIELPLAAILQIQPLFPGLLFGILTVTFVHVPSACLTFSMIETLRFAMFLP